MDPGFRRGDTGGGDIGEGSFIPRGSTQSVGTLWFKATYSIAAELSAVGVRLS